MAPPAPPMPPPPVSTAQDLPIRPCIVMKLSYSGEVDAKLSIRRILEFLEALTRSNALWLAAHPDAPLLYNSGARYAREKPGNEEWLDIPTIYERKIADCEDLACARAAELRVRAGIMARPALKWRRVGGALIFHVIVKWRNPDGTVSEEDPSLRLGMGQPDA